MFLISLGTFDMVHENFIHFLNFPANDCYWDKRKQLVILRVPTVNTQQKCTAVVLLQQITLNNHVNAEHEEVTISKFERRDGK